MCACVCVYIYIYIKILYSTKGQIKCRQMLKPTYPVGCEYPRDTQ